MSVNLHDPLSSADIPADRLHRLSAEQLRRAVEAGILAPGDAAGPSPRLSLDQYHRMDEGILTKDDRVELLGGWLVARTPINPPHRTASWKVRVALERIVLPGWYVDEQKPVTLPLSGSEPQPDVQVTRGDNPGDYADRHPGPDDVALLVEVSDSSLPDDRGFKKRFYAADRVAVYWIVNLQDRRLEVYTEPSGPADVPDYGRRSDYGPDDEVPVMLDGREVGRVTVRDLLP
jgi:hypothetical protein